MDAMCHFRYDREITFWLLGFMGKALPGTCFPEEVPYDIRERVACDAYAYELDMTLALPDGAVDIEVTMNVWAGPRQFDAPEPEPEFGDVHATRDVFDNRGLHLKTLYWDDGEGAWLAVELGADEDESV